MENERNARMRPEHSYLPANAARKAVYCPGRPCDHCGRLPKYSSLCGYGLGTPKPRSRHSFHHNGPQLLRLENIAWLDGLFCSVACAREVHPALCLPRSAS